MCVAGARGLGFGNVRELEGSERGVGWAAPATVKRLGGSAAGEVWQPEISGGRKKEREISLPAPYQNDYVKTSLFIEELR